jgi:hypothetical protein
MGKITKLSLPILGVVVNHFFKKGQIYLPTIVGEVKLNYLRIYVHIHHPKRIINKELHIISLWKSTLNVFLSR